MADIVLLATADWDHPLWTNKQHVACALADLGHRVLYIDSLGVRGPRGDRADTGRILRRLSRGLRLPRSVRPGVWVYSPLVLPGKTSGLAGRLNRWSFNLGLLIADAVLDLRRPLLWTFNPQTRQYLRLGKFHATVYQCVDRIQAQPGMPVAELELAERDLCSAVKVVFTTSPKLQHSLAPLNAGTHGFGNVADAEHFCRALDPGRPKPSDWPVISGPVLIFIGAIDAYKLDLAMLEALVRSSPHWNYVFIGPVGETDPSTDIAVLDALPNVHLLGPRSYATLPAYLAQADVALLPLQLNDYTRHMYPMKFFEYLAAGCPVVATAIPSLEDQGDVALLCPPDAEAFAQAISLALSGAGPTLEQRLARAEQHTYKSRTKAMLTCLENHGLMPAVPQAPQAPPYNHIRSQWRRSSLAAQLRLVLLRGLDRLGQGRLVRNLLNRWVAADPHNIPLLTELSQRLLEAGDYAEGCRMIERIWLEDGEADILHQLLFRRGSRPGSRFDQLLLFDVLAASPVLPLHYSGYCWVVRTYRAIDAKDAQAMRRGVQGLGAILARLEADPNTYRCLKPNRENRAKLLISSQLTRLRALMALEDWSGLDLAARELLDSARRYDPFLIERNTATRMTRNIMRSLTVAAVMAWHRGDACGFDAVLDQISRLREACYAERFDPITNKTQEDHRGFSDAILEILSACHWPADQPEARPDSEQLVDALLLVYFPTLKRARAEKAHDFFRALALVPAL